MSITVNNPPDSTSTAIGSNHVYTTSTLLAADKSLYVARYVEISTGITFEIGAAADLEIG